MVVLCRYTFTKPAFMESHASSLPGVPAAACSQRLIKLVRLHRYVQQRQRLFWSWGKVMW